MTVIALIDGPLPAGFAAPNRRHVFCDLLPGAAQSPATRHARQMADAILRNAPEAQIDNYVVFPGSLATSISAICHALDQAARSDALIVHCSFGVARSTPQLEQAIAAVLETGKGIVASAPARGNAVYPAHCDGVIPVQGDARCGPREWSWLGLPHAEFGACPIGIDPQIQGASTAAAHFTGLFAREIRAGRGHSMRHSAAFQGRERIPDAEGPGT